MYICVYVNKYTYRYLYIRVCMGIYMYVTFACIGDVYVQIHTHLRACVGAGMHTGGADLPRAGASLSHHLCVK